MTLDSLVDACLPQVLKAKFSDQAGEAEAAAGPLEATIKSLKNQIEVVNKENGELQRRCVTCDPLVCL